MLDSISSPTVQVTRTIQPTYVEVSLPSSKSISNRLLILQNLSNKTVNIENLSLANDTQILRNILKTNSSSLDVEDAGTAARFSLAWACIKNTERTISGSSRLNQRPMAPLIDALRDIGFEIQCLEKEGYFPVQVSKTDFENLGNSVRIDSSISSQFISALCLIAPFLPKGLNITLKGKITSRPYISMTLELLKLSGVPLKWITNEISIEPFKELEASFKVEADWSAGAFWYGIVSHLTNTKLLLKDLTLNSIQGDGVTSELFKNLGVESVFSKEGVLISRAGTESKNIDVDFNKHPDLAQPFIVACALKKSPALFSGLHTLKDKETNRILALQKELLKIGNHLISVESGYKLSSEQQPHITFPIFETYNDHRMAMSLSQCAFLYDSIEIKHPKVVSKSYPNFWAELSKLGITLK